MKLVVSALRYTCVLVSIFDALRWSSSLAILHLLRRRMFCVSRLGLFLGLSLLLFGFLGGLVCLLYF